MTSTLLNGHTLFKSVNLLYVPLMSILRVSFFDGHPFLTVNKTTCDLWILYTLRFIFVPKSTPLRYRNRTCWAEIIEFFMSMTRKYSNDAIVWMSSCLIIHSGMAPLIHRQAITALKMFILSFFHLNKYDHFNSLFFGRSPILRLTKRHVTCGFSSVPYVSSLLPIKPCSQVTFFKKRPIFL